MQRCVSSRLFALRACCVARMSCGSWAAAVRGYDEVRQSENFRARTGQEHLNDAEPFLFLGNGHVRPQERTTG